MNPYSDPNALGLDLVSLDEPNLSYEFNVLIFVRPVDRHGGIPLVYSAHDSGCSCPTPFDQYEAASSMELLLTMDRVRDYEMARAIFDGWRTTGGKQPFLPLSAFEALRIDKWFESSAGGTP